jgi:SOS response regulatory protein OraA/RecX
VVKSVERALLGDYTLYNNSKRVISSTSKYGVKLVNEAFADERDYVLEKLSEARKVRKAGNMKEYNKIIDQLVARGYSKAFILKKLK